MDNDNSFNLYLNNLSHDTPNRNKTNSGISQPFNYNNESFLYNYGLNESNGVPKLIDITDESLLKSKFENQEKEIKNYCHYYISLENIFKNSDLSTKNRLLQYVTEFNIECKKVANLKTNYRIEAKKNSEAKNKVMGDLGQKIKDFEKTQIKMKEEYEKIKEKMEKQIDEYKFKLNKADEEIKKLKNTIDKLNQDIIKNDKELMSLRDIYKNNNQTLSQDYLTISYCLGDQTENLDNINIYCPKKKDLDTFTDKFTKAENNFNMYAYLLVETSNKTLEQFKKIYLKIKGKEWMDYNNLFIKMHSAQTFNINQPISWTNIMNVHLTINAIISEIFELVNPTKECDPTILNKDSCDFLLDYIIGIKRAFFLQKKIVENSLIKDNNDNYEKILIDFKKNMENYMKFFDENDNILSNQTNFERFKNELKEDNTEILTVDDYINNFKTMFIQAKNISDKEENEFKDYEKFLNSQNNRNTLDDIEMKLPKTKNKNNNNGI